MWPALLCTGTVAICPSFFSLDEIFVIDEMLYAKAFGLGGEFCHEVGHCSRVGVPFSTGGGITGGRCIASESGGGEAGAGGGVGEGGC